MIIDSHTHVSVRCEADWDLDSAAATMKYCFQRNLARPHIEVRRLADDGSEFAAYNLVGPPFTPERYAQSLNYMRRRCDYMTQDDLRLIHGGNLQRVFDIPD